MKDNTILVLNGPGLADLSAAGTVFGDLSLEQIREACSSRCDQLGLALEFRQTDDDEEMMRWIAEDTDEFIGLIINPAGNMKSKSVDFESYAAAIESVAHLKKPLVEVHVTNIFREGAESVRPLQVPASDTGFVCGLGIRSYLLAVNAIARKLQGPL